jgi:hypothetical protein
MKSYDRNSPLFSMHIPKCGGTSLLQALRKWFWRWRVFEHYRQPGAPPPKKINAVGRICVHGHFNSSNELGIPGYYPQADQFITFLREPFDRYLSLWHFMPKMAKERGDADWLARQPDFATALRRRARQQRARRNFQSIVWYFPQKPDVVAIDKQMDTSFVFVGIMERYQESLDALAAVLGKRRMTVPHLNDTPRDEDDYETWRPFYRQHFADEYEVYEAALRRNDELLKRYL